MKDKIFIIWSGSDRAAQLVKRTLEQEHKYICIVGGSFESSKQMLTVGDTVIRQMISCNQAIVIFQNSLSDFLNDIIQLLGIRP